jgi:hypothetical protein
VFGPLIVAVVAIAGCGQGDEQPAEAPEQESRVAQSEVERGPVRVTVEVEPAKARLSDEPVLTLTIDYEKGVTVERPPFGESLGGFLIRDFREPLPRVEGDREIIQQIYTLEPVHTGPSAIMPVNVTFIDNRPDGDGKKHTIETEGLTIEVASVVDSELPSLDELRPPAGPVKLLESQASRWWLLLLPPAVLGGVLAWYLWRRRRGIVEDRPVSPRELAYLELERLLGENLADRDVKLFYVELTAVVRRYIERTTGILAPEQTTEEFLRQISTEPSFAPDERRRLKDFLESADLVKFAAYQPRREDLEESFRRAKTFVGLESMEVAA